MVVPFQVATILEKRKRKARPVVQYSQPPAKAAAAGEVAESQDGDFATEAAGVQSADAAS